MEAPLHPIDLQSAGYPIAGPLAVVRPPWVSIRDGVVAISAPRLRDALETMPTTVIRVGFSVDAQSSPRERELFDSMEQVLQNGPDAVVAIRSVPEAVKVVRGGWVVGSRDRSSLAAVVSPVLVDRHALERLLKDTGIANRLDLMQALLMCGGAVRGFASA